MSKKVQKWLESRWHLAKKDSEKLGLQLTQMNSLGFYEKLPLNPQKLKRQKNIEVIAYFNVPKNKNEFVTKIKKLESATTKLKATKHIPQGNWATAWKKYFKPFSLTPEIVIKPSWESYKKKDAEKIVTLDPGMAFGTGQHDTTRFCAELICELKNQNPELKSLIDVGCGSGILSIIAAKIGFKNVTGIDNDSVAIETAQKNLKRNSLTSNIRFILNSDGTLNPKDYASANVVVSNIIAETLDELSKDLLRLVQKNGYLILSGILPEKEKPIKKIFKKLSLVTERKSKHWHAYVYCKK